VKQFKKEDLLQKKKSPPVLTEEGFKSLTQLTQPKACTSTCSKKYMTKYGFHIDCLSPTFLQF
jgi:hypothetical protein